MTRHRKQYVREGSTHHFNNGTTRRIARGVSLLAEQNAKRVPCAICNLGILPGAMTAHVETVHGED